MMDFALAREAVQFYLADPDVGGQYAGMLLKAGKLALLLLATLFAIVWAAWADGTQYRMHAGLKKFLLWPALLLILVVGVVSWLPLAETTRCHGSVLLGSLQIFQSGERGADDDGRSLARDPMLAYRELTHAPGPGVPGPYFGREPRADVVLFVIETMPFACLEAGDPDLDLPNFQRLRKRAFYGEKYHTTSPSSSRAVFAMHNSWYPTSDVRQVLKTFDGREIPGLLPILHRAGYVSTAYSSTPASYEEDQLTYRAVSFDGSVHPEQISSENTVVDGAPGTWKARLARDEVLLGRMLGDMGEWIDKDQRYLVTFLPQVSHAPWPEVINGSQPIPGVLDRGRAMLVLQDAWLGRLLDLLERHGSLERTIIVFTGDHGLRNSAEDPSFIPGQLAERTFHLPLLIYAPRALKQEKRIPYLSSHLDIAPTILALLGIEGEGQYMLGSPIWDPRMALRRTYFIGRHYLGVDGFHENGRYCMLNLVFGGVQVADALAFDDSSAVPENSDEARRCEQGIEDLVLLQHRLEKYVSRKQRQ